MSNDDLDAILDNLEAAPKSANAAQMAALATMRMVATAQAGRPLPPRAPAHESAAQTLPPARVTADLPDKPAFSVEEAAKLLGLSRGLAYSAIQRA